MDATKLCCKCGDRAALVGSRCVPCYTDRYARRLRVGAPTLRSRRWWVENRRRFETALTARLMAIAAGLAPGPKEDLVQLFWRNGHFHPWTRNPQAAREALTKIIDGADAVVRGEWEWRKKKVAS